jgi:hypothetical protein
MGQRVSFATSQWKDKPDKPDEFMQSEWDAYNSSKFNGFPFPTIEKAQDNLPFEEWDEETLYNGYPSKSENRLISVLGHHYSYKFSLQQLIKYFWRMKGLRLKGRVWQDSQSRTQRVLTYNGSGFVSGSLNKINESELVENLETNKWELNIGECKISIDFNNPVLKLGEDDYRPFIYCNCCGSGCGSVIPKNPPDDPDFVSKLKNGQFTQVNVNYSMNSVVTYPEPQDPPTESVSTSGNFTGQWTSVPASCEYQEILSRRHAKIAIFPGCGTDEAQQCAGINSGCSSNYDRITLRMDNSGRLEFEIIEGFFLFRASLSNPIKDAPEEGAQIITVNGVNYSACINKTCWFCDGEPSFTASVDITFS